MSDVSTVAADLKLLRKKYEFSVRQLASELGFATAGSYQHYEDRFKKESLPFDLALKIVRVFLSTGRAEALDIAKILRGYMSIDEVIEKLNKGDFFLPSGAAVVVPISPLSANAHDVGDATGTTSEFFTADVVSPESAIDKPTPFTASKDVPVLGTAEGGEDGEFEVENSPIDHALRPPALIGAKDVYALYVVGNSMEPAHRPGDLIFVHPGRPALVGDDVIIQIRESDSSPMRALLKRLVRRNSTKLFLEQYNPPKLRELDMNIVVAVHRVLRNKELYGL